MRRACPVPGCLSHQSSPKTKPIVRKGSYYRRSDKRRIHRYQCMHCCKSFSSATFAPSYRQKKRHINEAIFQLLCSTLSQRRLAKLLAVNRKTIVRKFHLLAKRGELRHSRFLEQLKGSPVTSIQFDDLETSIHTKCKPVSVCLAVEKETRQILGFQVSQMSAKGKLAKISRQKYGNRRDERSKGWNLLFQELKSVLAPDVQIESDENPYYQKPIRTHLPQARHIRYPGARGSLSGQGELKKLKWDPLFALNHTCGMLRANINRLLRKTWCTSKTMQGLISHLWLYVSYHNQFLTRSCTLKGAS